MRYQGKISNWKDDQGFGFINPNQGGKQIFVHIKSFSNYSRRPLENDIVTYELKTDHKGRLQAELVAFVGEKSATNFTKNNNFILLLAPLFLIIVAGTVYATKLPLVILWIYLGISCLAFLFYYFDKSAAKNNQRRTPENTLHTLALLGGWPGALIAQQLFRHKSKKTSFQVVFWLTVFANCVALAWLITHIDDQKVAFLMHLI